MIGIFHSIGEALGIAHPRPKKLTPQEQQKVDEALRIAREEHETQLEEERREELKRKKVQEIKNVVHNAQLQEIFDSSGLEHKTSGEKEIFILPYKYHARIKIKRNMPFIEARHYVNVIKLFNEFVKKHSKYIQSGNLEIGLDAKLNKPTDSSRIVFNFPLRHNLVFVCANDELNEMQSVITEIVKDASDIFCELQKRLPVRSEYFSVYRVN